MFFIFILLHNTLILRFKSSIYLCNTLVMLFLFLFFWFKMWLPFLRLPQKVSIGQGTCPNLLIGLMGVMHLIQPNTIWYDICKHATMWLWNRPSIREEGMRVQDHVAMNAWVLNNPLVRFHCNEEKAIVRAKRCTFLEWDRLQSDLQYTPKVPKSTLVKLASSHIL